MSRAEIAIVGGGVAGASLAYHLACSGVRAALRERAPQAGAHASGRNARLVLQATAPPLVRTLTAASARAYDARAGEVGFARTGSLMLGAEETLAPLRDDRVPAELWSQAQARARVPVLAARQVAAALWTPGDGVLDPHRLLAFYLDGARAEGASIALGAEVTAIVGDGPFAVRTGDDEVIADRVVIAAGAWATEIAGCSGASPLPLTAYKRHLFLLDERAPEGEPYVWDVPRDVYYRADAEGIVACMCDEEASAALAETVTPGAEETLRWKLAQAFPWLAQARVTRAWSCFRTKAPDALPVIGPDPRRPEVWWLAGLAGYGLGASWEIGRMTASAMVEGPERLPSEVLPQRFVR